MVFSLIFNETASILSFIAPKYAFQLVIDNIMVFSLSVKETVVNVILSIGEALQDFFTWIISFLPDDPINLQDTIFNIPQEVQTALHFFNWFVPIADILLMVTAWITIILAIWFVRVLMKMSHIV